MSYEVHLYKCRRHGEIEMACGPREARAFTGRGPSCPRCGSPLIWKRSWPVNANPEQITASECPACREGS